MAGVGMDPSTYGVAHAGHAAAVVHEDDHVLAAGRGLDEPAPDAAVVRVGELLVVGLEAERPTHRRVLPQHPRGRAEVLPHEGRVRAVVVLEDAVQLLRPEYRLAHPGQLVVDVRRDVDGRVARVNRDVVEVGVWLQEHVAGQEGHGHQVRAPSRPRLWPFTTGPRFRNFTRLANW
jgi:hypothetical protein